MNHETHIRRIHSLRTWQHGRRCSHLLQQQPVRADGRLHEGPRLDAGVVFGQVDQPQVFSLTRPPYLWVDPVLKNHLVRLPVQFGLELLAVFLRHLDVWCGVDSSASGLPGSQKRGSCLKEIWLVFWVAAVSQDDAEGAVHVVALVGDRPGIFPCPEPAIPVFVLLDDPQGSAVPPTWADVLLVTTLEFGVAVLSEFTERLHLCNRLLLNERNILYWNVTKLIISKTTQISQSLWTQHEG